MEHARHQFVDLSRFMMGGSNGGEGEGGWSRESGKEARPWESEGPTFTAVF